MGLLAIFVLGMVVAAACIALGVYITLHTGLHFIENYVKKLTPADLEKLNNTKPVDEIPEEALWAGDLTESEFKKEMDWNPEQEPNY